MTQSSRSSKKAVVMTSNNVIKKVGTPTSMSSFKFDVSTDFNESDNNNNKTSSKVLIIITGGTFIMAQTENGLEVQPGYLKQRMSFDNDFKHSTLPIYDIYEWEKPMDSSNFSVNEWIRLSKEISQNYNKYDGFIILHGTDTMAYTASALSFMLENLSKPVVLTGAQIPIGEVFNDAKNNLIAALMVAGQLEICEVCLLFNNKLFRANRCTKFDPWYYDAFRSPNFPPLGLFGIELEIDESLFISQPGKRFNIFNDIFKNIIVITLYPGFNYLLIKDLLNDKQRKGIIFVFYGVGNSNKLEEFYKLLLNSKNNYNSELMIISQCQNGHVDTGLYSDESVFKQLNIINGCDMTVECAVTKLSYCMGKGLKGKELKKQMETSLKGELTPLNEIKQKILKLSKN